MYIKFWGVRGSVASGSSDTVRVGGNTTCVEIRCGKELIIIDTGTGFYNLGMALMDELPLERIWRDHRVERIWDGTSEIQRHIISRSLLRPFE